MARIRSRRSCSRPHVVLIMARNVIASMHHEDVH